MQENTDQKNSEYGHFSRSVLFPIPSIQTKSKEEFRRNHDEFDQILIMINFHDIRKLFVSSLSFQLKFYQNFMSPVETLPLFIPAFCKQLWELKLNSYVSCVLISLHLIC